MSQVREVSDDLVAKITEIVAKYCRRYSSTMDIWSDKLGYNSCLGKKCKFVHIQKIKCSFKVSPSALCTQESIA